MYLRHFALTRLPFETPAHTDELFESNARREAEARLQHLIELKGIGLLTGEVGSGKTTVCRHVAAALHTALYRVGYVSLTTGNVLDMYKAIAWELGCPPNARVPPPTAPSRPNSGVVIRRRWIDHPTGVRGQAAPRARHRRGAAPAQ